MAWRQSLDSEMCDLESQYGPLWRKEFDEVIPNTERSLLLPAGTINYHRKGIPLRRAFLMELRKAVRARRRQKVEENE
jgi:hypothetical protein